MAKQFATQATAIGIQTNCGCPSEYVDVGNGVCQQILSVQPTPPSQPITIAPVVKNSVYITYGAIIYEDITLKQWPIIASPQGGSLWALSTNTLIPASGPNPNPYLPGGVAYTSLNPGTDGINYIGGIGTNGEHARLIKPVPATGWPAIPLSPVNTLNGRALRESTITGGVLNYGIGNPVQPQFQLLTAPWKDSIGNSNNWFSNQGVDASGCPSCVNRPGTSCYVCAKWYGFTHCVTINTTKTYYVAVAANNAYRFKMNGNLVVEFNVADGAEATLTTASIFPITLPAGTHVFQVEMLNYSGDGGVVFEIYDCTLAQLQGISSLGQLDTVTIFSTKEKLGSIYDISNVETQGYMCPPGYVYSNCGGNPQCIKISTAPALKTNVKLTPCCGDTQVTYVVSHEKFPVFPLQTGSTACIEDIDPNIGCWLTEETCDIITYTGPFTVKGTFVDCFKCLEECKQCDETCKSCPPGYNLGPSGQCEKLESVPATQNPTTYIAGPGSWAYGVYSSNAGEFYEDITLKPWPIKAVNITCPTAPAANCSTLKDNTNAQVNVTNFVANAIWGGDGGPITNYRLKAAGLWTTVAPNPVNEWIGFTYCINLTATKTYYIGFAVDDVAKIYLDGVLMIDHSTVGWSFRTWKIIPVTLSAGLHILDGRVLNSGGPATFGFEIYDATLAQLLAVANPGDIDPYIVFTTADYIGKQWQTGQVSGYSCPDGYSLNTCDGIVCSKIVTTNPVACCFALKDCTTNEVVYLIKYTEPNTRELPDLLDLVTNKTVVGDLEFEDGPVTGCFYFDSTDEDCETAIGYDTIVSFTEYDTCKKCTDKCFLLTNCLDPEETLVTNTDLSQYINYVISIKDCKDKCWIVTDGADCEDCSGPVIILKACPPITKEVKYCYYDISSIDTRYGTSYSITINGVEHTFPFGPGKKIFDIFNYLNGLNLGQFTIGLDDARQLTVIGDEDYGNLCFTRCFDSGCTTTCIPPTCKTTPKQCVYTFTGQKGEMIYTIVVDGVTYTSPYIGGNDILSLLDWLNGIPNIGQFTAVWTAKPTSAQLFTFGDHEYGTLSQLLPETPPITYEPECENAVPDCACCLPKPEVVVTPLLNTRPVDPGYTTPGCSPEYTEKVNCAFGDVMNKKMLSARYGLKTCCEEPDTNWEIKKELLDFEAIKDTNLTPCNNEL